MRVRLRRQRPLLNRPRQHASPWPQSTPLTFICGFTGIQEAKVPRDQAPESRMSAGGPCRQEWSCATSASAVRSPGRPSGMPPTGRAVARPARGPRRHNGLVTVTLGDGQIASIRDEVADREISRQAAIPAAGRSERDCSGGAGHHSPPLACSRHGRSALGGASMRACRKRR
jgi:hypothetical protein